MFVVGASGLLALSIIGLPLAIAGVFKPLVVAIPTLLLWPVFTRFGLRLTRSDDDRKGAPASWFALAIALSFTAFTAINSSEHLLTNRDPGVYIVTGKWLSTHGDLLYHTGLPDERAVASPDPQRRLPQGVHARDDGYAYFQFQHAPAVVLATARWMGGDWLMFRAMAGLAGIGLLGLFVLSRRLAGQVLGLIPLITAVVHPAFIFVAKDAYSEMLATVFVLAAMLSWLAMKVGRSRPDFLVVGLILGATSLARIDAWLTGIGFLAGIIYMLLTDDSGQRITRLEVLYLLVGFGLTSCMGLLDLVLRSPKYLADLSERAVPLLLAFGAVAAATLVLAVVHSPTATFSTWARRHLPRLTSVTVAVAALFALYLRPKFSVVRRESGPGLVADLQAIEVAALQAREGLEVDPFRTYADMSVEWFAQYQGHLPVFFGILAISLATYVVLQRKGDMRTPVICTFLAVATLYLWRPSITPDHLWAMRRFVPVVLPLGLALTALGAREALARAQGREFHTPRTSSAPMSGGWSKERSPRYPKPPARIEVIEGRARWLPVSMSIVLGLALGNSLATGWSVNAVGTQVGMSDVIEEICDMLPSDAAVVFDENARVIAGAVRTSCDVPTTTAAEPGIIDQIVATGLSPVSLSTQATCGVGMGSISTSYGFPERTLSRPPSRTETRALSVWLTAADSQPSSPSVPDTAEAALLVELETKWAPESGSSVIAALGGYKNGMWLEYRPTGLVELWVTTDQGQFGVVPAPRVDDGSSHIIGGYLDGGILHGFCGEQKVAARPVPGTPRFEDALADLRPLNRGDHGNQLFEGSVEVIEAEVARSLIENR